MNSIPSSVRGALSMKWGSPSFPLLIMVLQSRKNLLLGQGTFQRSRGWRDGARGIQQVGQMLACAESDSAHSRASKDSNLYNVFLQVDSSWSSVVPKYEVGYSHEQKAFPFAQRQEQFLLSPSFDCNPHSTPPAPLLMLLRIPPIYFRKNNGISCNGQHYNKGYLLCGQHRGRISCNKWIGK